MDRRDFLRIGMTCSSMLILPRMLLSAEEVKKSDLPNIIYIMADDLGYGDPSCYGATKISTPHIDSLAKRGIRFTDAHTTSSVCTPTRYGILTGRYNWRSRLKKFIVLQWDAPLIEKNRLTMASMLKTKGYTTAAIGKWHLGWAW